MRKDLVLVAVIVATLALMVVPLSQTVIDMLLALNISLAVLLVVVALYLKHPSDFSTFPSVILIGTAFRLALSIGTTRLILSEADAGQIIETFGDFVVRGSVVIGLVIFLIITVVQFLVVTKGAERVAEVAARFALDAMPGKQMSIDAEMRNGSITADEAATRRKRLDRDSQFFGAMDGAMKFIKGDAIAGLIIICINLLGGIGVGMSVHGYSFGEAVEVFSLLTVGDGLVAQIPALLMSLCAGIVVTRVANSETSDLGTDIFKELVSDPRVPTVAAFIVIGIGFIPGFPTSVFFVLALILLVGAVLLRRQLLSDKEDADAADAAKQGMNSAAPGGTTPAGTKDDNSDRARTVSTRFRLLIGTDVAAAIDQDDLQTRLAEFFDMLHAARGIRFPTASCDVSTRLAPNEVVVELDEVPVFSDRLELGSMLVPDHDLALALRKSNPNIKAFDWPTMRGAWLPKNQSAKLRALDLKPVALESALAHLAFRLYERNMGTLFSNAVFTELMDAMTAEEPEATKLVRDDMNDIAMFKMFRYLIEDGVPLRPLSLLLNSLHYWINTAENPTSLSIAECLRGSMKRQLCHRIAGSDQVLGVVMVDPAVEAEMRKGIANFKRPDADQSNDGIILPDTISESILAQFRDIWIGQNFGSKQVAIVVSGDLRRRVRNFLAGSDLHFPVLAPHEISNDFITQPVDLVSLEASSKAA